jgi:hypothetical protein
MVEKRRKLPHPTAYRVGGVIARVGDLFYLPRKVTAAIFLVLYAPIFVLHTIAWAMIHGVDAIIALVRRFANRFAKPSN